MTARLRVILPPGPTLLSFALGYLVVKLPFLILEQRFGARLEAKPVQFILVFSGLAYAVYRVIAFHPFYRAGYHEWLERTPWTSKHPLPVGPPCFVWEDAFVLGGLALLATAEPTLDPLRLLTVVLLLHSGMLALTFWPTGVPGFGYAVLLAAGLAVRLLPDRVASLAASGATYGLAVLGLRRSLARFPWHLEWQKAFKLTQSQATVSETWLGPPCGWPYDLLRPTFPKGFSFDVRDALLVSMLCGWWLFALDGLIPDPGGRTKFNALVLALATVGLVISRFFKYRIGYSPPISLWGRIATFRWVIPGYDQIYVAPVLTLAASAFPVVAWRAWGWGSEVTVPAGLALMFFIALTAPPSLTRWRLTGQLRIAFSPVNQQNSGGFIRIG